MGNASKRLFQLILWLIATAFATVTLALVIEGAAPGISAIFAPFEASTTPPLGQALAAATLLHILLGTVLAWGIIIACLRRAGRNKVRFARWLIPLALPFAALGLIGPVITAPPVAAFLPTDPRLSDIIAGLTTPAAQWFTVFVFAITAAACLMVRSRADKRIALALVALSLICLVLFALSWATTPVGLESSVMVLPAAIGLLAFVAFLQSDGDSAGHAHILTGTVVAIISLTVSLLTLGGGLFDPDDTIFVTLAIYTGPYAMVTFLGFAVLDMRWQPRLPRALIWLHAVLLALATGAAFGPMAEMAKNGMPRGDVDFPQAFAADRFVVANGQILLLALILIGIAVMYRRRARPAAHQPLPTDRQIEHAPQPAV